MTDHLWEGLQPRMCAAMLLLALILTSCIQEAQWTWTGDSIQADVSTDQATADGSREVSPVDTTDTDTGEPVDTDIVQLDTVDVGDICVPDCDGKDCGDDGCDGTCGTCNGGSFCEGIETCQDGICVQDPAPNCDDGNPCTDDECDPEQAACTNILKPLDQLIVEDCLCDNDEDCEPLEDGDPCNGTLVCDTEAETPTCKVDDPTVVVCDDLPDGVHPDCNVPACDPETGLCVTLAANEGSGCSDGDACTEGELCTGGACFGGSEVNCDDGNQCTDDSCNSDLGCQSEPTWGATCDDGEFCSTNDTCKGADGSVCEGSGWESCEDGNPCTSDQCVPGSQGCYNPPNADPCDDGNACTENDVCAGGLCVPGVAMDCDDGNECTGDSCDPVVGCVFTAVDCDDGNDCTLDTCVGGVCDFDAEVMNGFECDDGTECTFNDACFDGECVATPAPEDQLEWLDCFCDGVEDCAIVDDGIECNGAVVCDDGRCLPGPPVPCDDGNECTDDVCDPVNDCVFTNNAVACDDGDPCTTGDYCAQGACVSLSPLECDDTNPCTDDECVTGVGCEYTPNTAPCEDGDPCTDGDHCEGGICIAGPDFVCDPDHDGVCLSVQCPTVAPDDCPTVWNPDADSAVCAPLPGTFPASRAVTLSQQGAPGENSTWRRTYEVVEIPLKNGILDNSVIKYWKLDGDCSDSGDAGGPCEEMNEPDPVEGAFGDENGAFYFDNDAVGTGKPFLKSDHAIEWGADTSFTIMLWVKADGAYGSIGGGGNVFGTNKPKSELHFHVAHPSIDFGVHIRDEDGNSIDVEHNEEALPDKNWHHYACVRNAQDHSLSLFLDGRLVGRETNEVFSEMDLSDQRPFIGAINNGDDVGYGHFHGTIDDVIVFERALSPTEIAAYCNSLAPYATDLVPGVQGDLDDIRITETSEPGGSAHQVPFEVLGPRPHSDTPCPFDDTDPSTVQYIDDREDLCGVVAYWKLDGSGVNETVSGLPATMVDGEWASGRYGDSSGAALLDGSDDFIEVQSSLLQGATDYTIELWFSSSRDIMPSSTDIVYFLNRGTFPGDSISFVYNGDVYAGVFQFVFDSEQQTGSSVKCLVDFPQGFATGHWHHLAVSKTGTNDLSLFVDGVGYACEAEIDGSPGPVVPAADAWSFGRCLGSNPHFLPGKIDDVLIHAVAKSPEYIYRRANPGVPTVRFLASTEVDDAGADGFDWYDYALHWGDGDATAQQAELAGLDGEECYGLLSPCIGYAGWWRFNEGATGIAVDSSTHKRASERVNVGVRQGIAGPGGDFTGDASYLKCTEDLLDGSEWTVEASVNLDIIEEDDYHQLVRWGDVGSGQGFALYKATTQLGVDDTAVTLFLWDSPGGYSVGEVLMEPGSDVSLAGTYDGTIANFYQGGTIDDSQTVPYNAVISPVFRIGSRGDTAEGSLEGTDGMIDEVRIMNRSLMKDEQLYYPVAAWVLGEQVGCIPDCAGKECGDDGCGGSCVACVEGFDCNEDGQCVCGGITCPELSGYTITCNGKAHCEYANEDDSGWKDWDIWIYIAPGSFQMGSTGEGGPSNETPVHGVTIGYGYFISKHEIVVSQYEACNQAQPVTCTTPSTADWNGNNWGTNYWADGTDPGDGNNIFHDRPTHPQNGLTWQQAKDFCAWVTPGGRLPSESEWEYAATGPSHLKYPWGNSPDPTCSNNTAVFNEVGGTGGYGCGNGGTLPVGSKSAGASWCGALDMSGNLWEWCEDWWHGDYNGAPDDGSAWVDPPGSTRVSRAGGFSNVAVNMRSARRNDGAGAPSDRHAVFGARCLRPL